MLSILQTLLVTNKLHTEIAIVQEVVEEDEIKFEWIKKYYQFAGVLTKKEASVNCLNKSLKIAKSLSLTIWRCK